MYFLSFYQFVLCWFIIIFCSAWTSELKKSTFLQLLLMHKINELWTKLSTVDSDTLTPRIVGGQVARSGEFPYAVALKSRTGKLLCGGSLINSQHVLTAAHCVKGLNPSLFKVLIGTQQLSDEFSASVKGVSQMWSHNGFNFNSFDWDVAVLKLASPVTLSANIQPVCMHMLDSSRYHGRRVTVIGWGRRREGDHWSSDSLRKVNVPVVNPKVCQRAYQYFRSISDRMLCAGFRRGGKDSCQGDSGGPMIVKSGDKISQIGIVSWGNGCARPGYYGVYTKIEKVVDWIKKITTVSECSTKI